MKPKVHNIPGLEYLYQRIPPDQLDLPDFVLDYDIRVRNGRFGYNAKNKLEMQIIFIANSYLNDRTC